MIGCRRLEPIKCITNSSALHPNALSELRYELHFREEHCVPLFEPYLYPPRYGYEHYDKLHYEHYVEVMKPGLRKTFTVMKVRIRRIIKTFVMRTHA